MDRQVDKAGRHRFRLTQQKRGEDRSHEEREVGNSDRGLLFVQLLQEEALDSFS